MGWPEIPGGIAGDALERLRAYRPIVHHITNYVTASDCANATLAIGGSPIMADAAEEVGEVTAFADALVLNLGTPNSGRIEAMLLAGRTANEQGIPVVLDPVGVGISAFRTESLRRILETVRCSIIRGNLSEISFLAEMTAAPIGKTAISRAGTGIDAPAAASSDKEERIEIARTAARSCRCIVVLTGATDIVTDGGQTFLTDNGHACLSMVTGTGCVCSSLIASFCGSGTPPLDSALYGVACMGIAGETAFARTRQTEGIGSGGIRIAIMDALSTMTPERFRAAMRAEKI